MTLELFVVNGAGVTRTFTKTRVKDTSGPVCSVLQFMQARSQLPPQYLGPNHDKTTTNATIKAVCADRETGIVSGTLLIGSLPVASDALTLPLNASQVWSVGVLFCVRACV